jgi:hypothetical protein
MKGLGANFGYLTLKTHWILVIQGVFGCMRLRVVGTKINHHNLPEISSGSSSVLLRVMWIRLMALR